MKMRKDSTISGPNGSKDSRMVWKTPRVLAPAASSGAGEGARGGRGRSYLAGRLARAAGGEGAARAQLLGAQLAPVVAGHVGVPPGLLAEAVEELAEGVVVRVGVLAHVHGGELEAEGGEGAD